VTVPLADNVAVDVPSDPEPYDDADVQALPVSLLDENIAPQTALTEEEIDEYIEAQSASANLVTLISSNTVPLYGADLFNCGTASPIAELPSGTQASIIQGPTNACGGDDWYEVTTTTGVTGWVSSPRVVFP
jgi:hypothetical protein